MPVPVDPMRARALSRMRSVAGALLVLMAVLLVLAHWGEDRFPALSFLRAFAEAALIGGLADWFAVTALFRHPLGLPIPHTAIVPRSKDRIGASLGEFIAENFLGPEVMPPRIKALGLGRRLSGWLGREDNARFVARRITAAIPPLVRSTRDEPVRRLIADVAMARLEAIDAGHLLSRLTRILMAGGYHLALFDYGVDWMRRFITENEETIRLKIAEKSAWWVPDWIDSKLARRIAAGLLETLEEMRAPDHPWRRRFDLAFAEFADRLARDSGTREKAESLKAELIAHPEVGAYVETLWQAGKEALLVDLAGGNNVEDALTGGLAAFGERLGDDDALREVIDSWINRAVLHIVVPNRLRIATFVSAIVKGWDTPTLIGKLELVVGRDLQFIRINGTLVGGLVGLALHTLQTVLP